MNTTTTSETFTCICCRREHPLSDLRCLDGLSYCPDCFSTQTVVCADCGERFPSDANCGDEDHPLCEHCYDRGYFTCDRCGAVLPNDQAWYTREDEDDASPLCWDCYAKHNDAIHDYSFKPTPIFYGDGPRYFGVELEIDGAGESDANARKLLTEGNRGAERIYCKHDGSLEDGIEIVTHPMSLAYHMDIMPWPEVIEKSRKLGYTSHQAGTCGLHVHVSRDAFGETETKQNTAIARLLFFVEKFWDELLKFSRRTQHQLDQWAARYGYKSEPQDILDDAKHKNHRCRYTAVNLTNKETVEFRLFRGTLKLNTFLATLQMVDRICDVALRLSDEEIKAMSWTTFVSGCTCPELVQYLKERRLKAISRPATPWTISSFGEKRDSHAKVPMKLHTGLSIS